MFNYYGSKSKIVHKYPKPKYNLIIEPFAGAAYYSVLHNTHQVHLNDKYKTIAGIWQFLIKDATTELILKYSKFYVGDNIQNLDIDKRHKDLIGFCIAHARSYPGYTVTEFTVGKKQFPKYASITKFRLKDIANNLEKIRHWKVSSKGFHELPNIEATWFIDPPYQKGGQFYKHNKINYKILADWCKSRKGQVIVCENNSATWMDFKPLIKIQGIKHKTLECIWTND